MRVSVYVDGFNLYYGALKGTKFKWLDLFHLSQSLYPTDIIVQVKYFTARVSGSADIDTPRRQATYLKALNTNLKIHTYMGNFLSKNAWRPVVNLPVAGVQIDTPSPVTLPKGNWTVNGHRSNQILQMGDYPKRGDIKTHKAPLKESLLAEIHMMEEKGSDVNLAVHLLNDAWLDLYDLAVVLSHDTDLTEPVKMVTNDRGKLVHILCPNRNTSVSPKLKGVSTDVKYVRPPLLRSSQFPDPVPSSSGPIIKPTSW